MYAKIKDSTQLFLLLLPVAENNVLLYSKDEPLGSRLLDGVRKNRQLHNIWKKNLSRQTIQVEMILAS